MGGGGGEVVERPRSMYTHKHPAGDGSHPGNIYLLLVTQRGSQPLIWPSAIFLCIFFFKTFFFLLFCEGGAREEGGEGAGQTAGTAAPGWSVSEKVEDAGRMSGRDRPRLARVHVR